MRQQFRGALALLATLAVALPALAQQKAANGNAVVAKIGARNITLSEFNKRYEQNAQLVPGKPPSKEEVLKNIVYFELATEEARRLGLHKDPALKEQFDILLYQAVVRRFVQPKIDALEVTEPEVRKYYDDNPLVRTSHIILLSRPGMSEKEVQTLRERAANVLEQVRTGKRSFEDLAREYSEGPTARSGGDVDWGARHKLLPEYYEAALALKTVGKVSELVETPYGIHIIKLTGLKPFAEIDPIYKDFIIRTVREAKGQNLYNAYFDGLKARNQVVIKEDLLK
jgi:parvulin-like peptidyl-prolyl isomerase